MNLDIHAHCNHNPVPILPRSMASYGVTRPQWVNSLPNVSQMSISYPLYNMWGCVFSVYPFPWWLLREYLPCLLIISKSEIWTITHCLGLGHEKMVFAVCLSIFLSQNTIDRESILVQGIVWCRLASSHLLSQCWPRCMSAYVVTRPQWIN